MFATQNVIKFLCNRLVLFSSICLLIELFSSPFLVFCHVLCAADDVMVLSTVNHNFYEVNLFSSFPYLPVVTETNTVLLGYCIQCYHSNKLKLFVSLGLL